jgi:hypothetical protein
MVGVSALEIERASAIRRFARDRPEGHAGGEGQAVMHNFYLGQAVAYNPPRGTFVPSGTWLVTEKLPERNGECYYRHSSRG